MGDEIEAIYTSSSAFALALPVLVIVPAIPEFLQHVVEAKLGMYTGMAAARAMARDHRRLEWGYAETPAAGDPGHAPSTAVRG